MAYQSTPIILSFRSMAIVTHLIGNSELNNEHLLQRHTTHDFAVHREFNLKWNISYLKLQER